MSLVVQETEAKATLQDDGSLLIETEVVSTVVDSQPIGEQGIVGTPASNVLIGLDSAKPPSPSEGTMYSSTDTGEVSVFFG